MCGYAVFEAGGVVESSRFVFIFREDVEEGFLFVFSVCDPVVV